MGNNYFYPSTHLFHNIQPFIQSDLHKKIYNSILMLDEVLPQFSIKLLFVIINGACVCEIKCSCILAAVCVEMTTSEA